MLIKNCLKNLYCTILLLTFAAQVMAQTKPAPLMIQEQGSFAIGGKVLTNAEGKSFHGDHAYVYFQVPVKPHKYPLIFVHGIGQFSKTWETTPDGREGFQNIFLRRHFSVYLADQPRRGDAGKSTVADTIRPEFTEEYWFNRFRIGEWPNFYKGVQFKNDQETLNQFFRQMTPDTGPTDYEVYTDAYAALAEKTGPAILITHSMGGPVGWQTLLKTSNIKGIVSYEPGGLFPFPQGEKPEETKTKTKMAEATEVSMSQFMAYTKLPIVMYYGDNIPTVPGNNPNQNDWLFRLNLAREWAAMVNKHGGNATVVHLPKIGIYGNTHFPFSDVNNLKIADLLSDFLKKNKLD